MDILNIGNIHLVTAVYSCTSTIVFVNKTKFLLHLLGFILIFFLQLL